MSILRIFKMNKILQVAQLIAEDSKNNKCGFGFNLHRMQKILMWCQFSVLELTGKPLFKDELFLYPTELGSFASGYSAVLDRIKRCLHFEDPVNHLNEVMFSFNTNDISLEEKQILEKVFESARKFSNEKLGAIFVGKGSVLQTYWEMGQRSIPSDVNFGSHFDFSNSKISPLVADNGSKTNIYPFRKNKG